MRNILWIFILALAGNLCGKDITVQRPRSYLREGPASYYGILLEVPVNTQVKVMKDGPQWMQVKYSNKTGYLNASAGYKSAKKGDPFAKLSRPGMAATTQGVTAGVKGFCAKFSQDLKSNSSFPDLALSTGVDTAEYALFYRNSLQKRKLSQFQKAFPLPARNLPDNYSEAAEGFGLSVAGLIAGQGLYKNAAMAKYLNNLGTYIASGADTPEIQYRFFILDISQPNAYACPGGYVFVTKGMLQAVENEAQLAFVLAHEIAHVSRFHGLKEVKLMENQIGAEEASAELDRELEGFSTPQNKAIEAELEKDISEMAAVITEGRLDAYEEEADELALLFIARSGYDPQAGITLLTKLLNTRYESNNQHYRRESVKQRLSLMKNKLGRYKVPKLVFAMDNPRFAGFHNQLDQGQ